MSIAVSSSLLSRALRIFDTFIKVIEKRGYQITVSNKTEVNIRRHSYSLRITEKTTRVKKEDNSSWDSYDYVPNGRLSFKIDRTYPLKEWSDTKIKLLEDKLDHILAWLEVTAKQDEEQKIASELWNKQYQENLQKEKDRQKLKDNELANFEGLFHQATRWHKSQYIRNYIKEFEEFAIKSNSLDSEKQEWIKWAKEKADWYDPFIEKDIELLKDIDRDTLKPIKKKYW